MRPAIRLLVLIAFLVLCGVSRAHADAAQSDPRWATDMELHRNGQYDAAATLLQALLAEYPTSQATAARLAMSLYNAGRLDEARVAADQAVALNPFGEGWAELAYLYKARACHELGCLPEALTAIDILKKRFPDAISTTRAEILEAEINNLTNGVTETDLAEEYAANKLITKALKAARMKEVDEAIQLLDDVIANYPHTRQSLCAMERKAYLLSMQPEDTDDCANTFLDIIAAVQDGAPNSRIRYDAELRLAALYQRKDMPYEAMIAYLSLADMAEDPRMAAKAALEAVGAHNEMLQKRQIEGVPVSSDEWSDLREHCGEVDDLPGITTFQRARLDLITAESFYWENSLEDALAAAENIISTCDVSVDRRGLATAHFIAGECHFFRHRYEDALTHFQWIVDEFGDEEIWGALKNAHPHRSSFPAELARLHFDIFRTYQKMGTEDKALAELAEDYLARFGDSRYAAVVRGWHGSYINNTVHKR